MTPVRKLYTTSTIDMSSRKFVGFLIQMHCPRSSAEAELSERLPRWPAEEARDE